MPSLGRNVVANYVGRTWAALLGIAFVPLYLRFLGIEAYGLVGFYATLSSVLGILDLGIGATMTRELARLSAMQDSDGQREVLKTLEVLYWGVAVLAGALVFFSAPFIAHRWIHSQTIAVSTVLRTIRLMGLGVALQFPLSLYQGGLMGLQRQVLVNCFLVITGTLRAAGAALVLWLISPTIEVFVAWQVAANMIAACGFLVALRWSLGSNGRRVRFQPMVLRRVWKYALAISANAVVGIILTQLDKVILSRMLPLRMFGYYSVAATVASAIWMIIIPFNTAVFPRFVQLYELNRVDELRVLFHRSSQVLSLFLLPICAVLIVFSREILFLWVRDATLVNNCHAIVSVLAFGTMLNGIVSIPGYSAAAFGWPQLIAYTNATQAIAMIPVIVFLVSRFGGIGAATGWALINSTYVLFMVPVYFRRFLTKERREWYLRDVGLPAVGAFAVCILVRTLGSDGAYPIQAFARVLIAALGALLVTTILLPQVRELAKGRAAHVFGRYAIGRDPQ